MNQKIRYLLIGGAGLVSLAVAAVAGLYLTGKTPPGGGVLDRITSGIQSVTGAVPAAHAGDMYAPAITARTSVGTVSIAQ